MIHLTLKQIVDFYDIPQIFVAQDAMNVSYLCVLYCQENGSHYLGVQLSELKLKSFMAGGEDLRKLYENPEQDNALYHVVVKDEDINAVELLSPQDITEAMLPAAGYYYDAEDAIEDKETDTLQLNIPVRDRGFFSDMVRRMGWTISAINQATRKVAVF